jgi:hypothetical protein
MKLVARLSLLFCVATAACKGDETMTQEELAMAIGKAIVAACPMSSPSDEDARVQCSAKLTALDMMRDVMDEPFLWGGQKAGTGYRLEDSDTTRFNAFVWRRMYLSLFMFTGEVKLESSGDFTVIHLPVSFRNQLDMGSYPYPFWHSKKKWDSWQYSTDLVLVMQKGRLKGALRTLNWDMTRPYDNRTWSGQWRWKEGGQEMPFVSLYSFLLSPMNPHAARLDSAYREMESEMRTSSCLSCHSPDNLAKASQLEFFNYPNQALYSRHSIVMHLEKNTMPPKDNAFGFREGLADDGERMHLLELARAFEKAGDDALTFEKELRPWSPPVPLTPAAMPDAGAGVDAATPMPDAATPMPDAATPMPDAATPMPDAATAD